MTSIKKISTIIFVLLLGVNFLNAQNRPVSGTNPTVASELSGSAYTATKKVNYFRTYDFYKALGNTNSLSTEVDNNNVRMSTVYSDGLGRNIQTIIHRFLPGNKDQVNFMIYDQFGRQVLEPLAYGVSSTDGRMRANPFQEQETSLSVLHPNEEVLYAKNFYDGSPLNQVRQIRGAGDQWAVSDKYKRKNLRPNTSSDFVKKLSIDVQPTASVVANGNYSAGTLVLSISEDEDSREQREYFNREGQIVAKRVQQSTATPGAGSGADWLTTYYIYDDRGYQRMVIPPKATAILEGSGNNWTNFGVVSDLIFQNNYDLKGRKIEKRIPGADWVYLIYDDLDRLILTQDGNQRNLSGTDEWSFIKYDDHDRAVIAGMYKNNGSRSTLQVSVDTWTKDKSSREFNLSASNILEGVNITLTSHDPQITKYHYKEVIYFLPGFDSNSAEFETVLTNTISQDQTAFMGYFDATFPDMANSDVEPLVVSYYDDYHFTQTTYDQSVNSKFTSAPNSVTPKEHPLAFSMETGSNVRVLGTDNWLESVSFFDEKGRVIQSSEGNHLGGKTVDSHLYDFQGTVLQKYMVHENPSSVDNPVTSIFKEYDYDQSDRLLSIKQKLNDSGALKTLVSNTYNSLGELEVQALGTDPDNPSQALETLNYKYNTRGWLSSVNGDFVNTGNGGHLFGYEVSYDRGFTNAQFSGNIAGLKWRSARTGDARAYGYKYDGANRLESADFSEKVSSTWNNNNRDYTVSNLSYDQNGNILSLNRVGKKTNGNYGIIDQLVYDYISNSNKLKGVSDGPEVVGFNNKSTGTSQDYTFDANGNATLDNNKEITSISYNHLDLPEVIIFSGSNRKIEYEYSATGTKLRKRKTDGSNVVVTDYANGFLYVNNQLDEFGNEVGRVRLGAGATFAFDYFIRDYLNNTRMTITEEEVIYLATMETSQQTHENSTFLNLDNTRVTSSAANITPGGNKAAMVAQGGVGPAKMMVVNKGDELDLEVWAYYNSGTGGTTDEIGNNTFISVLSMAFGASNSSGVITDQARHNALSNYYNNFAPIFSGSNNTPRAYLNYILFDENMTHVNSGFVPVSDNGTKHKIAIPDIAVNHDGYAFVYVSNASDVPGSQVNVYFDDLRITHDLTTIIQEDHFYPFGMSIGDLSYMANMAKPNNFIFNGKELQREFGLDWFDYGARNYDPQIGRWHSVDPKADAMYMASPYAYSFNNPILYQDKDGSIPIIPMLIKAGIGGALDVFIQVSFSYYFDEDVSTIGEAFDEVNWWQVTRASAWSFISTPGGKYGKAAIEAGMDVLTELLDKGSDYSTEQALQDFAIGFVTELAGGKLGDLISKYGAKGLVGGLKKMGFTSSQIKGLHPKLKEFELTEATKNTVENSPESLIKSATIDNPEGGLNLYKWGDDLTKKSTGWKDGDHFLFLPDQGSAKLNWKANFGALRRAMAAGKPIFDTYTKPNGDLIPSGGFLGAERAALRVKGWGYNPDTRAWTPPAK